MFRTIFLTVILICIFLGPSFANVPQLINFQGVLIDSVGTPLDGSFDITFRIYNQPTSGSAFWIETHIGEPVNDGLFAVILGSITPLGSAKSATSHEFWLGITIGSDPEQSPRSQLISVPFAFEADNADTAQYAYQSGSAGSADTAQYAYQSGSAASADTAQFAYQSGSSGSADTAQYAYWSRSSDTAQYSHQAGLVDTAQFAFDSRYSDTSIYAWQSKFSNTAYYSETSLRADTARHALSIADNTVDSSKITDNSIISADIRNATIVGADIAKNTITG
ncbi:MAG: hypothetical protein IH931_08890, partial [candidate division Zixibacteria bacterium]|nr:hypothetical protein [candidate division Zixibacteria bacterium]